MTSAFLQVTVHQSTQLHTSANVSDNQLSRCIKFIIKSNFNFLFTLIVYVLFTLLIVYLCNGPFTSDYIVINMLILCVEFLVVFV